MEIEGQLRDDLKKSADLIEQEYRLDELVILVCLKCPGKDS